MDIPSFTGHDLYLFFSRRLTFNPSEKWRSQKTMGFTFTVSYDSESEAISVQIEIDRLAHPEPGIKSILMGFIPRWGMAQLTIPLVWDEEKGALISAETRQKAEMTDYTIRLLEMSGF